MRAPSAASAARLPAGGSSGSLRPQAAPPATNEHRVGIFGPQFAWSSP